MARAPIIIRDDSTRQTLLVMVGALDLSKPWVVTVEPYKRNRSLEQNALYHKWVGIVASDTGDSHNAIHEWAKKEWLAPRQIEIHGKVIEYMPSTTQLKTLGMSEYMNKFFAWAQTMGIILPSPEDQGR
jgi:hypothetical protein